MELHTKDVLEMHDTMRNIMRRSLNKEDCQFLNKRETFLLDAKAKGCLKGKLLRDIDYDLRVIDAIKRNAVCELLYFHNINSMVIPEYMRLLSRPICRSRRKYMEMERQKLAEQYVETLNVTVDMSKHYRKFLNCSNHSVRSIDHRERRGRLSGTESISKYKCEECSNTDHFNRDIDSVTCAKCGYEVTQFLETYKSGSVRNSSCNSVYNRTMHFRDCLYQYQGIHNPIMSPGVYTALTQAMRECNVMGNSGDRIADGANITKGVVLYFLKLLNFTRHYDDAVYIHHAITGQKPDNVQHLEVQLIHDFSILSKKYDELYAGRKERRSFINMQIILYQLLRRHNHPCKLEDFASIKSLEQRARRDELYKSLFEALGWKYENI